MRIVWVLSALVMLALVWVLIASLRHTKTPASKPFTDLEVRMLSTSRAVG
jgi:hypothetical protein